MLTRAAQVCTACALLQGTIAGGATKAATADSSESGTSTRMMLQWTRFCDFRLDALELTPKTSEPCLSSIRQASNRTAELQPLRSAVFLAHQNTVLHSVQLSASHHGRVRARTHRVHERACGKNMLARYTVSCNAQLTVASTLSHMRHWHRSEANEELYDSPESLGGSQTVIQNRYCFWYKQKGAKLSSEDYESSIKQLASFQTVEHFWRIYNHLHRADQVPIGTDFHLFKEGIKPAWEDSHNSRGGLWMVRLKKGLAS
eukprot:19339-Heterococcus_DN1.PRE.1